MALGDKNISLFHFWVYMINDHIIIILLSWYEEKQCCLDTMALNGIFLK